MDLLEAFDVADCDFVGSNTDVGTIFGVQSVDVVYTPALQCCQFEWESREAGVPGPWHCVQQIAQSAGQDLEVLEAVLIDSWAGSDIYYNNA